LVEKLLRRKRVLVIVDHFSEMSEATRNAIHPRLSSFAVNALIVTSRNEEPLGGMSTTTLQPLRITGSKRTSSFMETYLAQCGKRALFTDLEFFDGCKQFAAVVGTREITILLARLYADQMVATKEDSEQHMLPKNIPDLMLAYLNELNRAVTENKFDDRIVHRNAKIIAWECVHKLFRPSSASVDQVLKAFRTTEDLAVWLKYLEDRLHLIQSIQPAQEHIRFLLDPLAEYLAALHLLDKCSDDEKSWHAFLEECDKKTEALGAIQPFLTAVQDCCLAKSKQLGIPNFVDHELTIRIKSPSCGEAQVERLRA
jgi:NACHT conflict system protein